MSRPADPIFVDELTGLSNERHFRVLYDFAFAAGDRGIPLTLVLFELGGFGAYREEAGEERARKALRDFATELDRTSREMDVAARLDGGRFLSLLRDCNLQGGLIFADRVRDSVAALEAEHGLPVSVGVAAYERGMSRPEELLDAVRGALRRAAAEGGGTVRTSRDGES